MRHLRAVQYEFQAVQEFDKLNRRAILDELAKGMKWKIQEQIESVHNYIDDTGDNMILRKDKDRQSANCL